MRLCSLASGYSDRSLHNLRRKNSILTTGIVLASPQQMFDTLGFGLGVNLSVLWTRQHFHSLDSYQDIMNVRKKPCHWIVAFVDHGTLRNGTKEQISEELKQNIGVPFINGNGDTVLHSILRNNKLVQKDVVEFFTLCLARGVDPNIRNLNGETAFHLAIERRIKGAVSCLLEYTADIHMVDERTNGIAHFFIKDEYEKMKMAMLYPLMNTPENREVTEKCSQDFARFLLDVGVEFDQKNKDDKSALDLAIMYNLSHLIPVLLDRINVKNDERLTQNFLPDDPSRSSSHSAGETSVHNSKYHTKSRRIIVSNAIKEKAMCLLDCLRELTKISVEFELTNGKNLFGMLAEQLDCKYKSIFELQKNVVELFTRCLAQGVDPNIQSEHEETERKMKEAVNCLLECVAGIDVVDQSGNGIAHFFIEDEYEKLKMSMSCPLMDTPENREITENCSRNVTRFLLDIGVDFDHKNEKDKNALDLAIIYNMPYLIPVLLEHTNVKPNYKKLIETLLTEISSKSSSHSPDEIRTFTSKYDTALLMLLDRGQADNNYGLTFLSTAIKNKREMSCIQTMINYFLIRCDDVNFALNMFEELTSTGAYWNESDRDYFSTVLLDLIARGVDINEVEIRKRLVRAAIKKNNAWLLDYLREMGMIFVDLELESGKNLIYTIAEQTLFVGESSFEFCRKFVNVLVRSGYDFNSQDRYGKTALQAAMDSGKVPMVQIIIESGVDLNDRDKCGRTALHYALMIGKQGKLIVKPPMRQFRRDRLGLPLHDGFRVTDLNSNRWNNEARMIVELLMNAGVDVNSRDSMLNTPLHYAVFRDDVEMMQLLLERNVDVNAKDKEGDTPLHLILLLRHKLVNSRDMMILLLKEGACPNVRNMHMETPLTLALLFDPGLAEELLRYNADTEDAKVRHLLRELHNDDLEPQQRRYYNEVGTLQCMRRHWMKLMAANLPFSSEYRNYMAGRVDEKFYKQCLTEIEKLMKILIDDEQSLYDFLHMHPRRRCTYMQRENLQQIMNSPDLMKNFPEISVLVMGSYQEARVFQKRETISVVLAEIFFKIYNVSYDNVAEEIVSFLREEDLLF